MLTAKDICKALKISAATLYRLIKAGQIAKPYKIGRLSRWPKSAIEHITEG